MPTPRTSDLLPLGGILWSKPLIMGELQPHVPCSVANEFLRKCKVFGLSEMSPALPRLVPVSRLMMQYCFVRSWLRALTNHNGQSRGKPSCPSYGDNDNAIKIQWFQEFFNHCPYKHITCNKIPQYFLLSRSANVCGYVCLSVLCVNLSNGHI